MLVTLPHALPEQCYLVQCELMFTVHTVHTCTGAGAVVVPGGVPGMPLPIVLVDEGLVLALKERIRGMAMQVVAIRKEAQYQVRWWTAGRQH